MGGATRGDESLALKPLSFQHAPVAFAQMKPQSLYGKQEGLVTGTKTESRFLRDSIVADCYCTYSIYVQLGGGGEYTEKSYWCIDYSTKAESVY